MRASHAAAQPAEPASDSSTNGGALGSVSALAHMYIGDGVPDPLSRLRHEKLALLQAGEDVIDLSMFNPDLAPQRLLLDKLVESSTKPHLHRYAVSRGVRKLREAFSRKYVARFGVSLDAERQVCVTLGSKDALLQALAVLTRPGDSVLCVEPIYPSFRSAAQVAGVRLVNVPIGENEDQLLESIENALGSRAIRMMLLNFPHNPTGRVVTRAFWDRLVGLAQEYECVVYNDFVYGELAHDGTAAESLLASKGAPSCAIESYSLSKAYSVPGWRVAALLGNADIVGAVAERKSTLDYGLFLPVQLAAAAALDGSSQITAFAAQEYSARAQTLCAALERIGCATVVPMAGGCVWARLPASLIDSLQSSDSVSLAEQILCRTGVVVTPGWYYSATSVGVGANGSGGGVLHAPIPSTVSPSDRFEDYIRCALVAPRERLREVGVRFEALLATAR